MFSGVASTPFARAYTTLYSKAKINYIISISLLYYYNTFTANLANFIIYKYYNPVLVKLNLFKLILYDDIFYKFL